MKKSMCNHEPLGCRTDGAIHRSMGSVSATSGPDTELQMPDEILQNFGMKTSFSKDVPIRNFKCRMRFYKIWHENEFFQGRSETPYCLSVGQSYIFVTSVGQSCTVNCGEIVVFCSYLFSCCLLVVLLCYISFDL